MNITSAKKYLSICDIICTVYLVLSGLAGIFLFCSLSQCGDGLSLIGNHINNIDSESVTAGYDFIGSLFGGMLGAALFFALFILAIVVAVFFLFVLVQRLGGWLYAKKADDLRSMKINVLLKAIPAILIHFLFVLALYDDLSNFRLILPFLGETVILYLCIQTYSFIRKQNTDGGNNL